MVQPSTPYHYLFILISSPRSNEKNFAPIAELSASFFLFFFFFSFETPAKVVISFYHSPCWWLRRAGCAALKMLRVPLLWSLSFGRAIFNAAERYWIFRGIPFVSSGQAFASAISWWTVKRSPPATRMINYFSIWYSNYASRESINHVPDKLIIKRTRSGDRVIHW